VPNNVSCSIGGIIKGIQKGYCFKVCFSSLDDAQRYKDFIYWNTKNDGMVIDVRNGYYDDPEKYNYEVNEK